MTTAIAIHCGSAHVRGKAREYRYFIASRFVIHTTQDGRRIWKNDGLVAGPFRSQNKVAQEARAVAQDEGALFVEEYGSLHNTEVRNVPVS